MDISHIEHIGIAVPSLDEAIPFYENILGFKCFAIEEVPDQKVRTAFFRVGQTKIELLEGTADDSAICKFIAANGGRGGIQHIAFAVEDGVANALAEAEEKGAASSTKLPVAVPKASTSPSFTPSRPSELSSNSAKTPSRKPDFRSTV